MNINKRVEEGLVSLLGKCNSTTLKTTKQIHAHLYVTGLHTNPFFFGKLLLHCASSISDHALHYSLRLFQHFPNPDTFMYNTLIRSLSHSSTPLTSLQPFIQLLRHPTLFPDSFSFAFALKGIANYGHLNKSGIQLHSQAFRHGFDSHIFVGTTLISMYAECGCYESATKVFEEMPEPNVVAWNAVVTASFRCGDVEGAWGVFQRMPIRNLTSWNVMLAGYVKASELGLARRVFSQMTMRDDVSWSTMIVGFSQGGSFDEAFGFFRELRREGIRPSEVSLTGVLSACAQAGAFEFGKILHGFMEKAGFLCIVSVNNALIDTYSKCGNVDMAKSVFQNMSAAKCVVSWTSMIAALAMHGRGDEAIQVFYEMEESGVRPDGVTFISLLYACSHSGLVQQGCDLFSKMTNLYGIEPAAEHYGCMVDLYGRAARLQEAYEFICQMPIPPNAIIWRTLLGTCSLHGNIELAELVKARLAEMDPNNSSDHVLLSNVYAVAGKWKDVAGIRRTMIEHSMKKTPGWSMIEIDKVIYRFVAGEKPNEVTEEAHDKLREIMLRLRTEEGYAPQVRSVLHDIEEEEKEDSVSKHSEKLAAAFGLAKLPKGRILRIVKNLRVCGDCHTVMKLISKVYQVEIIVRDRSRFHSFKNGFCSCRDYW
ncbi:pentatricopeptide repeat-containing protein At1g74630 [Cicer arietinum]|uniref:Pentatricopeptide repeat-containing protein At1g74630 n=1 Tax=Cicer arietinum TaxID=3827 RepID=A0A1S3EF44_CICAR|nr:pentatricopeptide repeat-containing protein At1g74630 [Cicer arietinum]